MKRGVMSLEINEVKSLTAWLKQEAVGMDGLSQRIESAVGSKEDTAGLQLSEEEVELLLDVLPAPGDISVLTEARLKLQIFLNELRG